MTASPTEGGTVSCVGAYAIGEEVIITATANTDYRFRRWMKDEEVISTSRIYSFNGTENVTLTAQFVTDADIVTVSIIAEPEESGTVTGTGEYYIGDEITVNATPMPDIFSNNGLKTASL